MERSVKELLGGGLRPNDPRRFLIEAVIAASRAGQLDAYLDDRYLRIRSLVSVAAEVFALRALARAQATDEQRHKLRDFFAAIADLATTSDELEAELYRAFRRPRAADA